MKRRNFLRILGLAMALTLGASAWAQGTFKTLYRFTGGENGNGPVAGLVFDGSGNLYGTTESGGAYNAGTVFELTPVSGGGWTESVLYSFTGGADGAAPAGDLIFDTAGNLYGTAGDGGASGTYCAGTCGVAYELTPTSNGSWTESVLYSFTGGGDGARPNAGLIFDAAGNLYGGTWQGAYISPECYDGCGIIYELTPSTSGGWTQSVIHTFIGKWDGRNSWGSLIFDGTGNLFGPAWNSGFSDDGYGVVFKLTPNSDGSWTEHVPHQFKGGDDGAEPQGHFVFDSAGNLYGITQDALYGGFGTVFELVPSANGGWSKRTLHQFSGDIDGAHPYSGLTFDATGNLYGVANDGGAHGYGVVFRVTPTSSGGSSYQVLHAFDDYTGAYPQGDLIIDGAGNLYGTTYGDGRKTFGSVFEITP